MGYSYSKRLTLLRQQTDESLQGRLGLFRTCFLAVLALNLISYIVPVIIGPDVVHERKSATSQEDDDLGWREALKQGFEHRRDWLRSSPLSIAPGASHMYESWAQGVVSALGIKAAKKTDTGEEDSLLSSLFSWKEQLNRRFANALLRSGFILIAFWPFWVIGFVAGYFGFSKSFRVKKTTDFLGVCDRGRTPFYSGIYGPLRSNNNLSGIDYSAPGLACPKLVPEAEANGHSLAGILQKFGSKNATNIDLIRVILQYKDFPCIVETEMSSAQELDTPEGIDRPIISSIVPFVTNAGGTIEQSAVQGLPAILEAHATLTEYVKLLEKQNINPVDLNGNYGRHLELLRSIARPSSPLVSILLFSLTPNRACALGRLPAHLIATAYLSTEAGKCLVFRRHDKGFNKISHYPHYQARAILQSLVSYHKEHKGEARMIIRQAIISSRRHGDFGRAFLPERMSVESRAIRDWLEILYAEPAKWESTAQLVELDAHVEEVSINWKVNYARRVRTWQDQERLLSVQNGGALAGPPYPFWKGMVYKSVILIPLSDLVSMALRGIDEARINRMSDLIKLTRRMQFNLSVMARLPGFKRLALETQQGSGENNPYFTGGRQELLKRWTVVRRMLTHYNWLSTRVGDYSVPYDGLIHTMVRFPDETNPQNKLFPFEAMVPYRQRRCDELFGKQWEQTYFFDSPHPTLIDVFVDRGKYLEALAARTAGSAFAKLPSGSSDGIDSSRSDGAKAPESGVTPQPPKSPAVASG